MRLQCLIKLSDPSAYIPRNAGESHGSPVRPLGDVYYLHRGVHQGSSQSPASYVRFCDVVPTALSSLVDDSGMRVGGVTLGRYRCTVSTFADDTLLLAEDVASTQLLLDRFSDICGHDFMALNTSKTVAMIVNAQPNAVPVPLMLNGAEIEYVDSLVYLGLTVRNTLSWTTHVTTQAVKAQVVIRERVSRVAHTDLPLHLQKADCKSRCWTVLEYGLDSAAATMEPESKCAFEQMYMRSCRALVHAGASGRGLQNAWILQELGMPRPEARLDWVALRFYFNNCMHCLPCEEVMYMPARHNGTCIPEGVRAMHFIMGTRGHGLPLDGADDQ